MEKDLSELAEIVQDGFSTIEKELDAIGSNVSLALRKADACNLNINSLRDNEIKSLNSKLDLHIKDFNQFKLDLFKKIENLDIPFDRRETTRMRAVRDGG